jgi:type 1 fimbria pilin
MKTKKAGMLGILFLAVLAVLAPCASAQESAAKGTLNGTVVDSTGGTIVGASVTLSGPFGDVNHSRMVPEFSFFRIWFPEPTRSGSR